MNNNNTPWYKRLFRWILRNIYTIFHFIVLFSLSIYIFINWNECISMQFFSRFNGNNILFILWLILIFLILYKVEAKDIKLNKNSLKEDIDNANMLHDINALSEIINQSSQLNQNGEQENTRDESRD